MNDLESSIGDDLRYGQRAALNATAVKFLLLVSKLVGGLLTGSLALIADALNSGSDVIVTMTSYVSLRLAQREPDDEFNYGYYKVENLAALLIAVAVLIAAVELILDGINGLSTHQEITDPLLAVIVASFSLIISLLLARYLVDVSHRTRSSSLKAIARDSIADAFSSVAVVVTIILTYLGVPYLDSLVSIAIAILVVKIGLETGKDAILGLLDVSPPTDVDEDVKGIISSVSGVRGVRDLKLRRAGPTIIGDVTIELQKDLDVKRAHDLAVKAEMEVKMHNPEIVMLVVHMEPYSGNGGTIAIPIESDEGLDSRVSPNLGRAPMIALVSIDGGHMRRMEVRENTHAMDEMRAGLALSRDLCEWGIDSVCSSAIGEIVFHSLRDCYIDILRIEGRSLGEIVERYLAGEYEKIESPTRESGG